VSRRAGWTLVAAALWTFWVWTTRLWNILRDADHSTGFKVVHAVLGLVSIGFGVALLVIGRRGLRRA
jgi:hypothetical protein